MDPFSGLAEFVLGRLKDSTIALWWKFLFEMAFSAVVSFLVMCGIPLLSGAKPGFAIGNGMVWAGMSMVVLFRKEHSRLTKDMLAVLPALEATKELASDFQTLQKEK